MHYYREVDPDRVSYSVRLLVERTARDVCRVLLMPAPRIRYIEACEDPSVICSNEPAMGLAAPDSIFIRADAKLERLLPHERALTSTVAHECRHVWQFTDEIGLLFGQDIEEDALQFEADWWRGQYKYMDSIIDVPGALPGRPMWRKEGDLYFCSEPPW